MTSNAAELILLLAPNNRLQWLNEHYPSKDKNLVNILRNRAAEVERDDPAKAIEIGKILHEVSNIWHDDETTADALLVEANASRLTGELTTAFDLYQQATQIYEQLGMLGERVNASIGEIDVQLMLGNYDDALTLANQSITYFRHNQDDARLGRTVMNRGNIFARQGQFDLASKDYSEAEKIFTTLGKTSYLGMTEANHGNILEELNEFRHAEERYGQARTHFQAAKMNSAIAQIDHNLAYLAFSTGKYQKALQLFAQAREVFANQQSTIDLAYVDLYRSEVYLALNLWDKAVEHLESAGSCFCEAAMPWEEARSILNEAIGLTHLGKLHIAEKRFETCRGLFGQIGIDIWIALGDYYYSFVKIHNAQYTEANSLCQRAYTVFVKRGMLNRAAQCQLNLGTIATLRKDDFSAKEAFGRARSVLAGADLPTILYQYYYGMAQLYQKEQEFDAAHKAYLNSFINIEKIERTVGTEDYKISFRKNKQVIYNDYIFFCLQQEGIERQSQAFVALERSKATVLLSALEQGLKTIGELPAGTELVERIQILQEELAWYNNRLIVPKDENNRGENSRQLIELVSEMEHRLDGLVEQAQELYCSPDIASQPRSPRGVIPGEVQAALPQQAVVVEFFATDKIISVFIISEHRFSTIVLDVELTVILDQLREMQAQMRRFRHGKHFVNKYVSAMLQTMQDTLYTLYLGLMKPVIAHIQSTGFMPVEAIIIVPHGILHLVPFHALHTGNQYLLEQFEISYAPSSAILCHLINRRETNDSGSPIVIGVSDDSIPQAEQEARCISTLFPNALIYTGNAAATNVLLDFEGRVPFLHLASHALFRADNPKHSAIKLNDQWLTLYSLESAKIEANLVTLSACETGLSEIHAGDELTGFYGVFFRKGIQALTLSLWQVDDASTAELMTYYYSELKSGAPCISALRTAQLRIYAKYEHPYYWAPFILTGNPFWKFS